jgi:hypothetical protein
MYEQRYREKRYKACSPFRFVDLQNCALTELLQEGVKPDTILYLTLAQLLDKSVDILRKWVEKHHSTLNVPPVTQQNLTSTFEWLLCPVCFVFDCNIHSGGEEQRQLPAHPKKYALPSSKPCPSGLACHLLSAASTAHSGAKFTTEQERLTCVMLLRAFPGAYCEIARMMKAKCIEIKGFAKSAGLVASAIASNPPPPKRPRDRLTPGDFGRCDDHRKRDEEPYYYVPCTHEGPCTETCPCRKNNEWFAEE